MRMNDVHERQGAALRMGLDGEALKRPLSGVGQYVFHLCAELERLWPSARFFVYARYGADRLALPSARWEVRSESDPTLRRLPSFVWLKTRGKALMREDQLDVFWAGRSIQPGLRGVRTVCTVHDLNHLLVPGTMQWSTRVSHALWFRRDLQRADVVLTNSQGTAQRLSKLLDVHADDVVLPGVRDGFQPLAHHDGLRELGIVSPYLLCVATLEPRKNVSVLLQAWLQARRAGEITNQRLVLVGARGWQNRALERELLAARDEGVLMAGYIGDEMMPALYAGAQALVCPSLYEGFGMPVLEARACGTPVVVADSQELREAGGPQAIVVPPTVEGVRDGLRRVLLHNGRLSEAGVAQRHAWRRSAWRLAEALSPRDAPPLLSHPLVQTE